MRHYSWRLPLKLNLEVMQQAAHELMGQHDFSAFCAAGSAVKDKVRTVQCLQVVAERDLVLIDAVADGFLYKMLRSIVGTLVEVGRGALTPEEVREILARGDRSVGPTAPPQGLNLWQVGYNHAVAAHDTPGSIGLTLPWGYVKISL